MPSNKTGLSHAVILVATAFGSISLAFAMPGDSGAVEEHAWNGDGGRHEQDPGHQQEGRDDHEDGERRLLEALGLSDAQREQVRAIHEKGRAQVETLESNGHANHDKIMGLSPKDPAFTSLVKAEKENAAARVQLRADLWSQIYAVLTPAQQNMIPVLITAAKNERAARESAWKDRVAHHEQEHQAPSDGHP
jgi:Spy/CpxP family protein refolding chaperone